MQNNSTTSLFECALPYQRNGDIEEAEKHYSALLADLPAALNNLGVIKRQKGQLEEAIRIQRLAIQIAPKNHGYHKNLIRILRGLKRNSEVERALAEAIKYHPGDKSFLWQLAKSRAKHKDPKALRDAVNIYKKYLALAPDDSVGAVSLANCLIRLGLTNEAVETLQPYKADSEINYKIQVLCDDQIDRAPADYVQAHFDRTARRFERQLVEKLDYCAPDLLLN